MKCVNGDPPIWDRSRLEQIQLPGLKKGARVHIFFINFLLILIGLSFSKNRNDMAILIVMGLLPIIMEFVNTSIELTNDRFGCDYNQNTKDAKDIMSAAVMMSGIPIKAYVFLSLLYKVYTIYYLQ